MKQTTKDWLIAAEDDFLAAKTLLSQESLTNLASFHCQQCVEKCFKALIEELDKPLIKSHDLLRLQSILNFKLNDSDTYVLSIINEVYIESRYPGELGLLPQGKPTISDVETFIQLCTEILGRIKNQIEL